MIKFEIKFQYKQSFLPTRRHKKPRERMLEDFCTVEITEPGQFPAAFIVSKMQSVYENAASYREMRERTDNKWIVVKDEIRTYNEKLYKAVRVSHGVAISTVYEGPEWIKDQITPISPYINNQGELFSEKSIVVSDAREDTIDYIRRHAANYLWYNDKVWACTPEPRYVVQTFGLGHNHGGTAAFVCYGYNPNIGASNYFNALQRVEAIQYGKQVALQRGDTESVDGMFDHINIEVLLPELVRVDPKSQHGDGDPFLNKLNGLINDSDSAMEAGILTIMTTLSEVSG